MTKTKKEPSKAPLRRSIIDEDGSIDWSPLIDAAEDVLRWASDLAHHLARDEEEDVRIAGVFAALGALLDGDCVDRVPLADILLVLRTIGRAIERDQQLAPGAFDLLATMLGVAFGANDGPRCTPTLLPTVYRLARHVEPRVVRAPSASLAEICALANRIAALVGPSGSLAPDFHR